MKELITNAIKLLRGYSAIQCAFPEHEPLQKQMAVASISACSKLEHPETRRRFHSDFGYQSVLGKYIVDSASHQRSAFRKHITAVVIAKQYKLDQWGRRHREAESGR